MATISQRSFAAGEITPAIYDRVDQVKRATGLKSCRNWIVLRHGGLANRPGAEFICEVENSSETVKLIPFVFNADQTYVLLFGDLTMRVIKDGILQREAATTITNVTTADPVVVTTSASHGYSNGDEVFITGVVGTKEVNKRSFLVNNVAATTFELQTKNGTNLDGTSFTAYVSGGTAEKVFELVTPYLAAELPDLHFAQSADIVTLTHPNHNPRDLARTGDILWTLTVIAFVPETTHPTAASVAAGAGGTLTVKYKVTAVNPENEEESLPGVIAPRTITNATTANPVVITTSVAHGYLADDTVLISGIVGTVELNDRRFTVNNVTATTFELKEEDGTGFTAYVSGGNSALEDIYIASANTPSLANPNVITWTGVTGVKEYNIYKAVGNSYGFIGIADRETFNDSSASGDEDITDTPPAERNPFLFSGNFPSTVTFHQQRRVFANTDNAVEDVFASRTGDFSNFTKRTPLTDDDTISWNLAGRRVNEVQSMIDLNGTLVIMTAAGEWSIGGNASGVLVPGDINPRQYSFNGSGKLQPILVNGSALYLQGRENIIRDLNAESEFESFKGDDLTIFSTHLFEDFTIKDMTFQQIPHSVAWFVRSDGTLLGLTRLKEQEILGWHRHDFEDAIVENVTSVPEGTEDSLYLVLKYADIDGDSVRYVVRAKSRKVVDVEDYMFLDSSVTIDGTNTTATTMTLSGGTTWAFDEDLTLTSTVANFALTDVGTKEIHLRDSLDDIVRLEIRDFTSTTVVTVRSHKTVPTTMRNTALTTWGDAVAILDGMWHLEGEDVSIFADGFVEASVYNPSHVTKTVSIGEVALDRKYVLIHGGKPITADIETLNIEAEESETLADKRLLTNKVILGVQDTRGLWVGGSFPTTNLIDTDILSEFQIRSEESSEDPVDLVTENITVNIQNTYTQGGNVVIRQVDAVPATVLSIHAGGNYPFRSR